MTTNRMKMSCNKIDYKPYIWMLAAALLMPITLGLACAAVSSDSPEDQAGRDAVNSAMAYIKANHADAAPYIPDKIVFTKAEDADGRRIGYSRTAYSGAGWTVTVGSPVTLEVYYEVSADYSGGKVKWTGMVKGGAVTEKSYGGTGG